MKDYKNKDEKNFSRLRSIDNINNDENYIYLTKIISKNENKLNSVSKI